MNEKTQDAPAVAVPKLPVLMGDRGLNLSGLDEAWRFAQGVIQGGMAPKGIREPGAVVAIIEAGFELGLPPMFALSNLTFINGRLGIMGDAAKALVHSTGKLRKGTGFGVEYEGEGDSLKAIVTSHREGEVDPVSHEFSVKDAKTAKLWGKAGPWSEYPKRMLMYRALGFHVRDQYPDVMMGAALTEELKDYPVNPKGRPERDVTPPADKDPLLELAAESMVPSAEGPPGTQEVDAGEEQEERDPVSGAEETVIDPQPRARELETRDSETTKEWAQRSSDDPPPPGDDDAPADAQLPLGKSETATQPAECSHTVADGTSAFMRSGDFEVCGFCGEMREPVEVPA